MPVRRAVLILCLTALVFISCRPSNIGIGVLLASPDEELVESGTVVSIVAETDVADSYVVSAPQLVEDLQLPRWRIERFDDRESANEFAAAYEQAFDGNTTLYARAGRNALPIRSQPELADTNTIYRLRDGETIKLIGRQDEETDLSGLVSYWYETLTSTGERGWVFGYTLELFDPTDASIVIEAPEGQDPLRELLLQNVWRPIWYIDMIANNAIDLEVFTPEFGLFPDPANNQIDIVLPWHTTTFEYEEILDVGPRRYFAEGTSLQMTFQRGDELSVQYSFEGNEHIQSFQRIDGEVDLFIANELDRRTRIFQALLEAGPVLASDNYGTLELLSGQRFRWTGYQRLVPTAVPTTAGESGTIDLGLFLSSDLLQQFDGALGFRFENTGSPVNFAYSIRGDGVRFVYVRPEDLDDRLVRRSDSALTIFMSSAGG